MEGLVVEANFWKIIWNAKSDEFLVNIPKFLSGIDLKYIFNERLTGYFTTSICHALLTKVQ